MSQAELLIAVAIVGLLSAIGVGAFQTGLLSGSRGVKLDHDTSVLNSAVRSYMAFGGDFSGATTPDDVLSALKSEVPEEDRNRFPGISGSFVDPETVFIRQSEEEALSDVPRLYWKPDAKSFVVATSGPPGIKSVQRKPGASPESPLERDRNVSFEYASKDKWIWDYTEQTQRYQPGPSQFNPSPVPDTSKPPITSPPPSQKDTLASPTFSIPPGSYPADLFDLKLALSDPNPSGAAQVFYSVDFGTWSYYAPSSKISVSPGTSVKAQALPIDNSLWEQSRSVEAAYEEIVGKLKPPGITFSKPLFNRNNSGDTIEVELTNSNQAGSSKIVYQLLPMPGGAGAETQYIDYGSPFTVRLRDYPGGFGVQTYASSTKVGWEDSLKTTRFASVSGGLEGGHLDLDTSDSISAIGKGDTDAHTHDITGKYGISSINFLAIPDSKQIEIDEAMKNRAQRFKLVVVNGSLSPGLMLQIDYEKEGTAYSIAESVASYDDRKIDGMEVFTFGGVAGTARLTGVKVSMSSDVLLNSGVIPTNTGDVRDNTPGKDGEWRNGAFTLQAVEVGANGNDNFTLSESLSNGGEGAASSGLLWEGVLFWHWDGDSYHESGNNFKPGSF